MIDEYQAAVGFLMAMGIATQFHIQYIDILFDREILVLSVNKAIYFIFQCGKPNKGDAGPYYYTATRSKRGVTDKSNKEQTSA